MGMLDQVLGGVVGSQMQRGRVRGGGSSMNKVLMLLLAAGAAKMYMDRRGQPGAAAAPAGQGSATGGGGGGLGDVLGGALGGGGLGGGGLGGILGSVLGGGRGGAGGGLGGLLTGAGGLGGLGALVEQFQRNGHGREIQSWVSTGANHTLPPQDLERALGPDVVDDLAQHTGMPRDQMLEELSHTLPEAVDQLTPAGALPPPEQLQLPHKALAGPEG